MKRASAAIVLILLGGLAEAQPMAPTPQFTATTDLATALRAKDAAKVLEILADDAILMAPGHDLVAGRKEIEAALKDLMARASIEIAIASLGSADSGVLGFDAGQYQLTLKPTGGGPEEKSRGKYLAVLKQDVKGKWRISYLSWNTMSAKTP